MASDVVSTETIQCLSDELLGEWINVARYLEVPDGEIFNIKEDNKQRIKDVKYEILLTWKQRKGSQATTNILESALRKAGRADLADRLLGSVGIKQNVAMDSCKITIFLKSLRQKYENTYSVIRPVPWKKNNKWSIKEFFVDINIAILDQRKDSKHKDSWTSLDSYESLFTHDKLASAKRIIIEADPGCGKTTLMYQLAYLWCSKKPPMQDVDIFLLLPLRKMRAGMSIVHAIKQILLPTDTSLTEDDIQLILKEDLCKVLALDGLDEYSGRSDEEFEESEIMASLKGEIFSDVKEILSTRLSCLPPLQDCNVERVVLEKFDTKHWSYYTKKAFKGEEGVSQGIMKTIKEYDILRNLCETPLFLVLIAHVLKEDIINKREVKFNSATDVFKHIITCMRSHHENKKFGKLVRTDKENCLSINDIAFAGLLESTQLQWDKDEIEHINDYQIWVDAGILVEEEGDVEVSSSFFDVNLDPISVRFMHKLFQEWFAARHLSEHLGKLHQLTQNSKLFNEKEFHFMLRFTCGLNPEATKPILEGLLEQRRIDSVAAKPVIGCIMESIGISEKTANLQLRRSLNLRGVDILCQCFVEHAGNKNTLKTVVEQICQQSFEFDFFRSEIHKAQSLLLQFASEHKIPVTEIFINEATSADHNQVTLSTGISLRPPTTAKSIHFLYGWPGDEILQWLTRCEKLETLIVYDYKKNDPREMWKFFEGKRITVYCQTSERWYQLRHGMWMESHNEACKGCQELHIAGIRLRCKTCLQFNLCETCKKQGVHSEHHFKEFDGTEAEHGYPCDECREYPIRGIRYRCESCVVYNLCDCCKCRGVHAKHTFVAFNGSEYMHYGTECNSCKENRIIGNRYKCSTCVSFNLCECCRKRGEHKWHEFQKLDGKEREHEHECSKCNDYPIVGIRYKCLTCQNYNLCECCKKRGEHDEHKFIGYRGNEYKHHDKCNGCGDRNIVGVRYKCKKCTSFNICECCRGKGEHQEHSFQRIDGSQRAHFEIKCNSCGRKPIMETRFKCKTCLSFNLCEDCKDDGKHAEHDFQILDKTDFCHVYKCDCCSEKHIKGLRFRCKTCLSFNLCECCKDREEHSMHEFRRFDGSEHEHLFTTCNDCKEWHIKGLRFRCKTCGNINLCKCCKEKGEHDEHELQIYDGTELAHVGVECKGCKIVHFRGNRYRCKMCLYVNLCEECKEQGKHNKHEFQVFSGREVKHDLICDGCDENPIVGIRYHCKVCEDYDLCECCKNRKVHPRHEFEEICESLKEWPVPVRLADSKYEDDMDDGWDSL